MKQIKLKGKTNKIALIDDEDFEHISKFHWCGNGRGAAKRVTSRKEGHKFILMHREIMGAIDGQMIDHIDRNPLNNQKSNLRFCTYSQNNINTGLRKNNKSGHKGVYWELSTKKWLVQLTRNSKTIYIGRYVNKQHAINARRAIEQSLVAFV